MFKFIHAADIHLDSPLRGLDKYEGAPISECRSATRRALENLVRLAIEERVAFLLIAGDVYDGAWPDYNTGLHFGVQMTHLKEAGIRVVLIRGNHDAENRMTRDLRLPDNVLTLSTHETQTIHFDDWDVAIHGRSYARRDENDNLAAAYPRGESSRFNIGLLHTSATGYDGHERYAPCTVDELRSKQYDYWALGHIHGRAPLHQNSESPIIFPGNLQGRHIRESGPKGCMLVTVDRSGRAEPEFRSLDILRWERCAVNVSGAVDGDEILERFESELARHIDHADGRLLALRVELRGHCPAHGPLTSRWEHWVQEVRNRANEAARGRVWVEKVESRIQGPVPVDLDDALAELNRYVAELQTSPALLNELAQRELGDLKAKLPPDLDEFRESLDDPRYLAELLSQVEPMLIGRLLAVDANGA
jgi:DNA repair exonuclease SbcCD nuclease subunit